MTCNMTELMIWISMFVLIRLSRHWCLVVLIKKEKGLVWNIDNIKMRKNCEPQLIELGFRRSYFVC